MATTITVKVLRPAGRQCPHCGGSVFPTVGYLLNGEPVRIVQCVQCSREF